ASGPEAERTRCKSAGLLLRRSPGRADAFRPRLEGQGGMSTLLVGRDDLSVADDGSRDPVGWPRERDEIVGLAQLDGHLGRKVLDCLSGCAQVLRVDRDLFGCCHRSLQGLRALRLVDILTFRNSYMSARGLA